MVDKLARSIEGRAQIAFQKVKDDILFLNGPILSELISLIF